jgi:hypothetical protein
MNNKGSKPLSSSERSWNPDLGEMPVPALSEAVGATGKRLRHSLALKAAGVLRGPARTGKAGRGQRSR